MSFETWKLEHFDNLCAHMLLARGLRDSRHADGRWRPVANDPAGRTEFRRRLRLLVSTDDSALHADERVHALKRFASGLPVEEDALVLAASAR